MSKPVHKFQTEDHERAFWSAKDSTEYLDWSRAAKRRLPNLKPSLKTISQRLPAAMVEDLKALANQRAGSRSHASSRSRNW